VDVYRGKQRDKFLAGINNGWLEALLVSYETLRMDFCLLNAVDWSCVIFDEVHRLKRTLLSLWARFAFFLGAVRVTHIRAVQKTDRS
jgi:SNF2 family DNA or RNA helicase